MRDAAKQPKQLEVLGIVGSLREGSFNRSLLEAARIAALPGMEIEIFDGLGAVPLYDQDRDTDDPPAPVRDLRGAISRADALLIATPEYNHSVPGVLKNAVDWASRPYRRSALQGKAAAVMGTSPSRFGAQWAQEDLRKVLAAAGAEVLDRDLPVSLAAERFDDEGRLNDEDVRRELSRMLQEFGAFLASDRGEAPEAIESV